MNKKLEKKLNELGKLSGYQKPAKVNDVLKLDSNENLAIKKEFQTELIREAQKRIDIRTYPLGGVENFINSLAKYLKVPKNMISVGNGSDQILDLFLANLCTKSTKILTSDPTFGFFEERCKLYSINQVKIPFSKNMDLRIEDFIKKAKSVDMIYLDSPNNPTGFQFSNKDLEKLIKSFSGPIIIDEAYGEFSEYSLLSMVKTQSNLIVVQTLSKSFGLAGLRLGYFIASKKFTETFMNVLQYPYPVSTITIESGILALEKSKLMKDTIDVIKIERKRIVETLQTFNAFEVFDSKANFVLFDAHGAYKRIYSALAEQGISIRKLG
ncbi:MAG: histidinol-phosphate aminotransferase family protein, partial [Candidatus Nitrosopelagicus sp.]|nr:histidinol-phosphate aminotransferase family protein [Candidatus Nitrosopelagicus sp.]